jgi:glycosyltransferase involved in cell wall biosynthesis
MKIVQWCNNTFPAKGNMGAERVVERTCRGLTKLGHKVWLCAKPGSILEGIECVTEIPAEADIVHHHGWEWDKEHTYNAFGKPWVSTIHGGGMETDPNWLNAAKGNPRVICVSKFVADRIGALAYVHACSDHDEFIYKEQKQDYFLYLSSLDWGLQKGLEIFVNLARKLKNHKFVIAGGTKNALLVDLIKRICIENPNLKYVGEVNGKEKAELFANAKAYILPTQLPDACPTTVSEALMSGTPVIGSIHGSMPEIVNEKVGRVCKQESDYVRALATVSQIKPQDCRDYAIEHYSDVATAKKYITYYENVLKYGHV